MSRTVLKSWLSLNEHLMKLNREEIVYAMEVENASEKPRTSVLRRLGQRYSSIRAEEVRKELNIGVPEQ